MSSELNLLLKLINEDKSINEISSILNIDNKELFKQINLLKKSSIFFNKQYYYNGDIFYKKVNSKKNIETVNTLYTEKDINTINAIIISDLHLCSDYERLDLLNQIYNYAIKNNIHLILNCGDLVDGLIGKNNGMQSISQINYLIKNYPFDKSINNFICLGNHDESMLLNDKKDISYYLECERHDLVCLGYGTGILKIKNDEIILKHPATNGYKQDNNLYQNKLILKGHTHFMKFLYSGSNCILYAPSLSDISTTDVNLFPSAILMQIHINDDVFERTIFSQLMWNDNKFVKTNCIECDLSLGKSMKNKVISKNEKKLTKKYK